MASSRFTRAVGDRVQMVGDDLLVTDADRLRDAAARGGGKCVLLKPNQRGTLTEALDAWTGREGRRLRRRSSRRGRARPRTSPSSISPWAGAPGNSRSAVQRAASAWRNGTKCCASRRRSAARPVSPAARCSALAPLNVVFHYAAGSDLARRLDALPGLRVTVCPEDDDAGFRAAMADAEVLWHVLKPCTATGHRRRTETAADPEDRRRREHD